MRPSFKIPQDYDQNVISRIIEDLYSRIGKISRSFQNTTKALGEALFKTIGDLNELKQKVDLTEPDPGDYREKLRPEWDSPAVISFWKLVRLSIKPVPLPRLQRIKGIEWQWKPAAGSWDDAFSEKTFPRKVRNWIWCSGLSQDIQYRARARFLYDSPLRKESEDFGPWSEEVIISLVTPWNIISQGVSAGATKPDALNVDYLSFDYRRNPLRFVRRGTITITFRAPTSGKIFDSETNEWITKENWDPGTDIVGYKILVIENDSNGEHWEVDVSAWMLKVWCNTYNADGNWTASVPIRWLKLDTPYQFFIVAIGRGLTTGELWSPPIPRPYPAVSIGEETSLNTPSISVESPTRMETGLFGFHGFQPCTVTLNNDLDKIAFVKIRWGRVVSGALVPIGSKMLSADDLAGDSYRTEIGPFIPGVTRGVQVRLFGYGGGVSNWSNITQFTVDDVNPMSLSSATVTHVMYPTHSGFWKFLKYRIRIQITVPQSNDGYSRRFEVKLSKGGVKWSYWHSQEVTAGTEETVTIFIPVPFLPNTNYVEGQPTGYKVNVRAWVNLKPGTPKYPSWTDDTNWGEVTFSGLSNEIVPSISSGYPYVTRKFARFVEVKPVPDTYAYPGSFHFISIHASTSSSLNLVSGTNAARDRRKTLIAVSYSTNDKVVPAHVPWRVWNGSGRSFAWLTSVYFYTVIHVYKVSNGQIVSEPEIQSVAQLYNNDGQDYEGVSNDATEFDDHLAMIKGISDALTIPTPTINSSGTYVYPEHSGFFGRVRYNLRVEYTVPNSGDTDHITGVEIRVLRSGSVRRVVVRKPSIGTTEVETIPLFFTPSSYTEGATVSGLSVEVRCLAGIRSGSAATQSTIVFGQPETDPILDLGSVVPSVTLLSRVLRIFTIKCVNNLNALPPNISHFTVHCRAIVGGVTDFTPDTRAASKDRIATIPYESGTVGVPVFVPFLLAGTTDGATPNSRDRWVGPLNLVDSTYGVSFRVVAYRWVRDTDGTLKNIGISYTSNVTGSSAEESTPITESDNTIHPIGSVAAWAGDMVFAPAIKSNFIGANQGGYVYNVVVDKSDNSYNAFAINDIIIIARPGQALDDAPKIYGKIVAKPAATTLRIDFGWNGQTPTQQQLAEALLGATLFKVGSVNNAYRYIWMDSKADCMKIVYSKAGTSTWIDAPTVEATFGTSTTCMSITSPQIFTGTNGYIYGGTMTNPTTGIGYYLGYYSNAYQFRIGNVSGQNLYWNGSTLAINAQNIIGATISGGFQPDSNTSIDLTNWSHNITFSSSNYNAISWTSGTLKFSNNVSFSINSGSATFSSVIYIYFDRSVSTSALQTTTDATVAVGTNKCLICVASATESGKRAQFQVFGGSGVAFYVNSGDYIKAGIITSSHIQAGTILASNIAAGTITGDRIASNTITANNLNVSQLSTITANLGGVYVDPGGDIYLKSSGTGSSLNCGMICFGSSTNRHWAISADTNSSPSTLRIGRYLSSTSAPDYPRINLWYSNDLSTGSISFYLNSGHYMRIANDGSGTYILLNSAYWTDIRSTGDTNLRGYTVAFYSGGQTGTFRGCVESQGDLRWDYNIYTPYSRNLGRPEARWNYVYCITCSQSSSLKYKKDVSVFSSKERGWLLSKVKELPTVVYKTKDTNIEKFSIIADQLYSALKGSELENKVALYHPEDDSYSLDLGGYTTFVLQAVKELVEEVEVLHKKVDNLAEGRMSS